MAFPDRQKLAAILGAGGVPTGADPQAAGVPAPPEAGAVPPREGPTEAQLEQAGEQAAAAAGGEPAEPAAEVAGLPTEGGGLMPPNLSPEQQEQMQAELALAARRKMAGM